MRYLTFGMKNLKESQIENENYSHRNLLAVDYCGKDSNIESWYAFDGNYKVLAVKPYKTTKFANTMFITPCNVNGKPMKVRCADGKDRYVTIALSHDNVLDYSADQIIKKNHKIYDEGVAGNATGNHIHVEVGEGIQYSKIFSNNKYRLRTALFPSKVFFVRKEKTNIHNDKNRYKVLIVPKTATARLKRGSNNHAEVKLLQQDLNFILGCNLVVDGIFGSKTEKAVKQFQRKYEKKLEKEGIILEENGHYGPKTQAVVKYILSRV